MSRQTRKQLPLELRWRLVEALPEAGKEVEICFIRFLEDSTRITVARQEQRTYAPHHLTNSPVPVIVHGWGVSVNGESMSPDPLAFLDACYAGWAVLVEAVPRMAQVITQATSIRSQREGWNPEEMEVRVAYADRDTTTTAGADGTVAQPHSGEDAGGA